MKAKKIKPTTWWQDMGTYYRNQNRKIKGPVLPPEGMKRDPDSVRNLSDHMQITRGPTRDIRPPTPEYPTVGGSHSPDEGRASRTNPGTGTTSAGHNRGNPAAEKASPGAKLPGETGNHQNARQVLTE